MYKLSFIFIKLYFDILLKYDFTILKKGNFNNYSLKGF